jgi:hypothetical protein
MLLLMLSVLFVLMLLAGTAWVNLSFVASFLSRPSRATRIGYCAFVKRFLFRPRMSILLVWLPLCCLAIVVSFPLVFPVYQTHVVRSDLRGVSDLRIRAGGLFAPPGQAGELLFETTDASLISELLDHIEFEPEFFPFECHCQGELRFEFYDGDRLIRDFSLQHGTRIRLGYGWYGDLLLSGESQEALRQWLNAKGVEKRLTDLKRRIGFAE